MKEHCKQNIENIVASQLNDHSFVRQRLWLLPSILSHSSAFDRSHINLASNTKEKHAFICYYVDLSTSEEEEESSTKKAKRVKKGMY